ncbi:MAG: acetoacetate--CoA ligase [Alphaproteobacteria bacterium]|nr:acetoacetate--CoA ligase [Alphaproteobacteria bacterium]
MTDPLWQPSTERVANANLTAFMRFLADEMEAAPSNFDALSTWSVEQPEDFWAAFWRFSGVKASRPWDRVLTDGEKMPGAKWFEGARLNFAENMLRNRDDHPAIIAWTEHGHRQSVTYKELYLAVAKLAAALKADGVGVGDRVAAVMPHAIETIVAMLAVTSIGAVWSSCSPDFGKQGLLDRFGQIDAKVLITIDGYRYNGKPIDIRPKVRELTAELATLERIVMVPFLEAEPAGLDDAVLYADYTNNAADRVSFEQLPFDHPAFILYSSGTTGVPKAIVHGAGGTFLQHQKELMLHTDLKREDKLFYFTTCGWMMWNWQVSALGLGATLVVYDGSPFHPDGNCLFNILEKDEVTVFGTSAKFIDAVKKADLSPAQTHDLSALKAVLSTGSPLVAESFDFVYQHIKQDLHLASISGGTDIVSCFVLGNPIGPVRRGEIQSKGLGMAVEVWNDEGEHVVGERGELVCVKPFPSMPVGFWKDPDGARYRGAYFERFPGVWTHGDMIERTPSDGYVIHGRSDAVLNPGGVRIGTAEIYRQVEQIDEVMESIAVGQEWQGDVRVVLFVRLRDGVSLDDELIAAIRKRIRDNTTPRHVPAKVVQIADIPRTMSGKIVELAVRDVIHGRKVKNTEALANPQALGLYRDLAELET